MGTIRAYRVDVRELKEGDVITSPGDHIDRLLSKLRIAELMLRGCSAQSFRLRAESLYAFTNKAWCTKYFLGKKGFLYEIELDENDILHAADMMLVNEIAEATTPEAALALTEQYWAGEKGNKERLELLARKAVVRSRLYTVADKVRLKNELYR